MSGMSGLLSECSRPHAFVPGALVLKGFRASLSVGKGLRTPTCLSPAWKMHDARWAYKNGP